VTYVCAVPRRTAAVLLVIGVLDGSNSDHRPLVERIRWYDR